MFTFAADSIVKKNQSQTNGDDDDGEEDEDSQEAILLRGSPSKKEFLDKVKHLKAIDQLEEQPPEQSTPTDHDLQTYAPTAAPKEPVKSKPIEPDTIVSERSSCSRRTRVC